METQADQSFLGCAGLGILISTLSWFFTDIRYVEEMEQTESKTGIIEDEEKVESFTEDRVEQLEN